MIQTSCDIHSGYSGGGLFDFATKELIGMRFEFSSNCFASKNCFVFNLFALLIALNNRTHHAKYSAE
jgi:hypothetical protein